MVMPHRDEYFYDICWEAGLNPSDQADWVNISQLFSNPDINEQYEELKHR
jgi:hypothetical protein